MREYSPFLPNPLFRPKSLKPLLHKGCSSICLVQRAVTCRHLFLRGGAYDNLTGSGDLKLLGNRSLKNALAEYYAAAKLTTVVQATHEMELFRLSNHISSIILITRQLSHPSGLFTIWSTIFRLQRQTKKREFSTFSIHGNFEMSSCKSGS